MHETCRDSASTLPENTHLALRLKIRMGNFVQVLNLWDPGMIAGLFLDGVFALPSFLGFPQNP